MKLYAKVVSEQPHRTRIHLSPLIGDDSPPAAPYPFLRHFHKSLNAVTSSWMACTFGVSPSSLHASHAFRYASLT